MSENKRITHSGLPDVVIRQHNWTEDELRAMGYEYYERRKEVTMARELPGIEAPRTIRTAWGDELVAEAGYMVCYYPGDVVRPSLHAYYHWPVEPEIFKKTYKPWDEPGWEPTSAERHLMQLGCQPFYKTTGVWAKKLEEDVYLQSLEHVEPVKVATGMYVAIGIEGEPYSMSAVTMHRRYTPPGRKAWRWIRNLLK